VDDSSVTVVTIGGNEYFQITGLGNAGGFSAPNNTPTDIPEENISTIEMTFSATKKHGLQHFF
jgi:hypothetical protein